MIVKAISHEQRKKAAAERKRMRDRGEEPPLKRFTSKEQAAHVLGASGYFMRPTKAGEKALGIEGHRVHRTTDYLVGDRKGSAGGERLLHVAHRNFNSESLAEQQTEMIALMSVKPDSDDAFEHLVLSPGPDIVPTPYQLDKVPERLLELLGAADHQAFVVWHGDTRNIHCHIGVSRIDRATGRRVQLGERWLIDTIGQAIAQIEHEQRWPAEENALYRANERGVFRTATDEQVRDAQWNRVGRQRSQAEKRAQDEAQDRVKLSTGAAEYERHQRLWSDERAAQAIAWPIIRDARSWNDLHRGLAREGMRYEKTGSGAKLWIGETERTATSAHWAASIKKRSPTLGNFEPRASDIDVAPYVPRRLDGAESRAAYMVSKTDAAARKQAERAGIAQAATDATLALTREHHRLQQVINGVNWSGHGDQLELARKVVGAVHRSARDAVESNRRETDQSARNLYRFPGFETWLHHGFLLDDEEEEEWQRRRRARSGILLGTDGHQVPPAVLLPGYDIEDDDLERRYLRGGKLRFVDRGTHIEVADALERESVRDALLVANAKWGKVQLTGDRRFRELAADIAVELDIPIANPELRVRIARAQQKRAELNESRAQGDERLRQRAAMVIAGWPFLRMQDNMVIVDEATRERHLLSVEDMRQPVFQAELRRQVDRQKPVVEQMLVLAQTRPDAFRNLSGKLVLPDLGDEADVVRQHSWLRDPRFAENMEAAVARAEMMRREANAQARERHAPKASQQGHPASIPPAPAPRPAATVTRGWNGTTLDPEQRARLLAAARARLAAEDWNPADYPLHADQIRIAAEHRRTSGIVPTAAHEISPGRTGRGPMTPSGRQAAASALQGRTR